MQRAPSSKKRLAVFGSTGSVGVNTLDVVRRHSERYQVQYLTTNRQIDTLREQILEFSPKAVVVLDEAKANELRKDVNLGVDIFSGNDALEELARRDDYDTLIGALVGFAGLKPTIEAIRNGKRICIANKETLVVAGELLTSLARSTGSEIVPIDSEHSAIAQCLVGEEPESIKRIILTASGGPFRTRSKESFSSITLAEALKHPNWLMGQKITIDSATLMNKGLEIIEAKWLFHVPLEKIDVIVHPQSIVHSMVEFVDGSVKAQLGAPDMRLPIQYALEAPHRLAESFDLLDLLSHKPLEFYPPDSDKFPALRLAREAGDRGGLIPCVLNAANEVAVAGFLAGRISFVEIPELIEDALRTGRGTALMGEADLEKIKLDSTSNEGIRSGLEQIFDTDMQVRKQVEMKIAAKEALSETVIA